ncbi:MAG: DUF1552 domain-containing protein [Planctomycetaceae bacterium]
MTHRPEPSPTGLSRRRFLGSSLLRGLGTAVAVPAFASLRPATAAAATARPTRMAFVYVPNGVHLDRWRSRGTGRDYELGPTLEPLAGLRDTFQVISGLAHRNGTAGPDGAGDHARATATILTGMRPRKTAGADIRVGISVDQVAAQRIGRETRLPSLELSCDATRPSGSCDSGYACAYSFNMSWRSASQPATAEANPRLVFERLFGAGSGSERARSLAARRAGRRSILDFVAEDARSLGTRLDAADRRKLDEYLAGIRELEAQLTRFDRMPAPDVADVDLPDGPPPSYADHMRLMADMLVLAFRTDSTRIATLMFAHDGSNRTFPEIGVGDGHHSISHHQDDADKLEKIARIDRFYTAQFAYLLGRLQETAEPDGTSLLDQSMVVYASGLSDGNHHRHDDLPVILAGRAGGRLAAGRLLELQGERPMSDLFVTMLDLMGAPVERFGDSAGRLDEVLG